METESHLADSSSEPSFYEILGVAKDAPLKRIRSKYLKSVLQCHPDRVRDDALKEQRMHEFYQVQMAYEILSDESQRGRYDERLDLAERQRETAKSLEVLFPCNSNDNFKTSIPWKGSSTSSATVAAAAAAAAASICARN